MTKIHTCSYHCRRPKCIEAQRDELRDKMDDMIGDLSEVMHKRIAEAVAAEREACAKVCDENIVVWLGDLIRTREGNK